MDQLSPRRCVSSVSIQIIIFWVSLSLCQSGSYRSNAQAWHRRESLCLRGELARREHSPSGGESLPHKNPGIAANPRYKFALIKLLIWSRSRNESPTTNSDCSPLEDTLTSFYVHFIYLFSHRAFGHTKAPFSYFVLTYCEQRECFSQQKASVAIPGKPYL